MEVLYNGHVGKMREIAFRIVYEGKDITEDISKHILDISYNDIVSDGSDEFSFTVHDKDDMWKNAWLPSKGDKVQAWLGYESNMLSCGTFTVDDISASGPPDIVNIKALAASTNSPLRTKNSNGFESQTLKKLVLEFCNKLGFELVDGTQTTSLNSSGKKYDNERAVINGVIQGVNSARSTSDLIPLGIKMRELMNDMRTQKNDKIYFAIFELLKFGYLSNGKYLDVQRRPEIVAQLTKIRAMFVDTFVQSTNTNSLLNIEIGRQTQSDETDLAFLTRIAGLYGFVFSVRDNKLIFSSVYDLEKSEASLKLDRKTLSNYSFRDKATKTYKKAVVKHKSTKQNAVIVKEVEDIGNGSRVQTSDDILEIRVYVENEQQAEAAARSMLHKVNSKGIEGTFSFPGNPDFVAGVNFQLVGFGLYSGKWAVTESNHSANKSGGYVTSITAKMIGIYEGDKITIGDVLFDHDKAIIKPEGEKELEKVLIYMNRYEKSIMSVEGHTDSNGTEVYNMELSKRRSEACINWLINRGILATRLRSNWFGESKPVATNTTPEGRAKNRRTDFIVVGFLP